MTGRLIKTGIARIVPIVAAWAVLATGPAVAGTLTLNFDAYTNGGIVSGCNLWTTTTYPGFSYTAPCSGFPLGMSAGGGFPLPAGSRFSFQTTAPPGITINDASVNARQIVNINNGKGWGGGSFYHGGGGNWPDGAHFLTDSNINSSYWGFAMICGWSKCSNIGMIQLDSVSLTASEITGPSLNAIGGNNLWYQVGHWIWNPPGDPFPLTLDSQDASGVCTMSAQVGTHQPINAPASYDLPSLWQQCEERTGSSEWTPTVDTSTYVPTAGALPLSIQATNAAGVTSTVSESLSVDNAPVTVSISTPNDADPNAWVGHAVTVASSVSTGPSGVGGHDCSVDGVNHAYSGAFAVNGTGVHTITCVGWNNAYDPQFTPNSGRTSMSVRIDETPPSLSFEPQDPNAPTNVIVDTGDGQSGVSGGSIEMAPAGTQNWARMPTSFDGRHLIARVNDAGLTGSYVIRGTSCDNVGNCAATSETLTMPLRITAASQVSFTRISAPAIVIRKRVLVGWHWRRLRINGHVVRVRLGGHLETVRVVIGRNARCAERRVQVGPHRWRIIRVCRRLTVRLSTHKRVPYGQAVTINGRLVSSDGVPIAGAHLRILTSPENGLNQFRQAATVTTAGDGAWSATLPAGPSRTIAAVYGGSGAVLPATGEVTVSVSARIALSVTPRRTSWGGTITLSGRVKGGYVPAAGELVLLWVGWHGGKAEIGHLYTGPDGSFQSPYTFLRGNGREVYTLWAATARESDYPYTPADSRRMAVTVGSG